MAVLVNAETRVLVQGITGSHGSFHTRLMLDYCLLYTSPSPRD